MATNQPYPSTAGYTHSQRPTPPAAQPAVPRDSNRSKFAMAETEFVKLVPDFVGTEGQSFLTKVKRVNYWKNRINPLVFSGQASPTLNANLQSNPSRCGIAFDGQIHLHHNNPLSLLHLMAHYIQPLNTALHGPEFIKEFLGLVGRYVGVDMKRSVKDILIKYRIKTKAVSGETRIRQRDAYMRRKAPEAKEGLQRILSNLTKEENDDD